MSRKNNQSRIVLSALLAASLFSFAPHAAHALTLTPPRLEIAGDPGQTVTEQMTLINEHTTAETYYSSYANFEAEGETGAPAFVDATEDLGTWMSVPASVTLAPGASVNVPIKITIPSSASAGGHFAAIFWGNQPNNVPAGQVVVGAKTGMLVLLRVSGNVSEAGGVVEFDTLDHKHFYQALPIGFYYRFQNGGGDRVKPVGDIVLKDTIGLTAAHVPGNPVDGNILPQSTRRIETVWSGKDGAKGTVPTGFFDAALYEFHNFALGYYGAHLDLSYGTKSQTTDSVFHFWVFPWQLVVVVVVGLLLIFLILKGIFHQYNKWVIGRAEALLEARGMHPLETRIEEPAERKAPARRAVRRAPAKKRKASGKE